MQVKNGPVSSVGGKLGRRALCDVTNKLTSQVRLYNAESAMLFYLFLAFLPRSLSKF